MRHDADGRRQQQASLSVVQPLESRAYLANVAFAAATSVAAGSGPQGVVVADLNRDNKTDVAVTNFDAGTVTVLRGNGNGTFAAPTTVNNVGANLSGLTAGDLNGDGNVDLVAIGDDVSILIGNGNGTFKAATHITVGDTPQNATIGDLNGDGKADMVVANALGTFASVLLGNGNGTFQAAIEPPVAGQADVAIGDLNGDDLPDLAMALFGTVPGGQNAGVAVLTGKGDGTFNPAVTYTAGTRPSSIAIGDFNGDGAPDLVAANGGLADLGGSNDLSVLINKGDGTYAAAVNLTSGVLPNDVVAYDFNGDGFLDLAAPNSTVSGPPVLNVHQGLGNGSFLNPVALPIGGGSAGVALGDFNGDGPADLVTTNSDEGTISLLRNTVPGAAVENGVLNIIGSPSPDDLGVTVSGANFVVRRGSVNQNVPAAGVTRVSIRSADGDDLLDASTLTLPVFVDAGAGSDRPSTGTGADTVLAGEGNDVVWGNDGNDKIVGGAGDDTLSGGAQKDTLDGGLGRDRLNGNGGNDRLFGNAGADRLYGYNGNDALDGGSSADRLEGNDGLDTLLGQSGNDRFFAADSEVDQLFGGIGADTGLVDAADVLASMETTTTPA